MNQIKSALDTELLQTREELAEQTISSQALQNKLYIDQETWKQLQEELKSKVATLEKSLAAEQSNSVTLEKKVGSLANQLEIKDFQIQQLTTKIQDKETICDRLQTTDE